MTRFSMQIKMLDIICSYLHGEHLKGAESLVKAHIFINLFDGNAKFSADVKREITNILDTKAEISFKNKHHLLSLINSSNTNRSVFSTPIINLKPKSLNNKTQPVNRKLSICSCLSLNFTHKSVIQSELFFVEGQSGLDTSEQNGERNRNLAAGKKSIRENCHSIETSTENSSERVRI